LSVFGARTVNGAVASASFWLGMFWKRYGDAEPPYDLSVGVAGGNSVHPHPPVLTVLPP